MDKPAKADFPICELVRDRWSPRAFSDSPIPDEDLRSLFEAARWAPSCFNDQPWSFLVATKSDPGEFDRMVACLSPSNQRWAGGAAVLMIAVARIDFGHSGKPNRHALYDLGQSVATLTCQATSMGLRAHQMAGFSREKAKTTFAIPEGFEPTTAIAVGYPGDPSALPEDLRAKELAERTRAPITEFVFTGSWNKKAF